MTGNNRSLEVVFTSMGRTYALCRSGSLRTITASAAHAGTRRQVSLSPHHDMDYVNKLLQFAKVTDLQKLILDESLSLSLNDKQLHTRILSLLKNGSIVLFECVGNAPPAQKKSSRKAAEDYEYIDPKKMPSASEVVISQPPTIKAPTKANDNPLLDEQALTLALIAAATAGAAFCEICAKREET